MPRHEPATLKEICKAAQEKVSPHENAAVFQDKRGCCVSRSSEQCGQLSYSLGSYKGEKRCRKKRNYRDNKLAPPRLSHFEHSFYHKKILPLSNAVKSRQIVSHYLINSKDFLNIICMFSLVRPLLFHDSGSSSPFPSRTSCEQPCRRIFFLSPRGSLQD